MSKEQEKGPEHTTGTLISRKLPQKEVIKPPNPKEPERIIRGTSKT